MSAPKLPVSLFSTLRKPFTRPSYFLIARTSLNQTQTTLSRHSSTQADSGTLDENQNPVVRDNFFQRNKETGGDCDSYAAIPKEVKKLLTSPTRTNFLRVDRFNRFLDYTPYDDPRGYVDMGVSFPRQNYSKNAFQPTAGQDPADVLSSSLDVEKRDYARLHKKVLLTRYTSSMASRGKIRSVHAMVVVGNMKGLAGLGSGKGKSAREASRKAFVKAYKHMETFELYDNRTIFHGFNFLFHKTVLQLMPQRFGYGLRVNPMIHHICTAIGIKDLGGKTYGSRNRMNVVKGIFAALREQRRPEDLARARGLKVSDVMLTYYGKSS